MMESNIPYLLNYDQHPRMQRIVPQVLYPNTKNANAMQKMY